MLYNYIRTAFRNFKRNSIISLINLFGLALGLATCLVAGLYIQNELKTDQFHRDVNSIFTATFDFDGYNITGSPYLLTETLEKHHSFVKETLRTSSIPTAVKIEEQLLTQEVLFADSNFFSFFTFPLQHGNEKQVLSSLNKIVISQRVADQYYKEKSVLGEIISIKLKNEFRDFAIAGIAAPIPEYSSMHFDFLIPLENLYIDDQNSKNEWFNFYTTSFVKVDSENVLTLKEHMPAFVDKYIDDKKNHPDMRIVLNSFAKHHLENGFHGGGLKAGRDVKGLYVFAGIAILILLLACFNFMNLTNAQSSKRFIEVGIRKVVGAGKVQLMRQFLTEALLMSFFAAIFSLGIAELGLLLLHNLLDANLSVFNQNQLDIYLGLFLISVVTGMLAGSYPAFVLANLNTLNTFKRHFKIGGDNLLTRSILSLQFALSIILIVCAIVMWKQQEYMLHKDLGYNKEQVLIVKVDPGDTATLDRLKNELLQIPEVINASKTSGLLTGGQNATFSSLPDGTKRFIFMQSIDEDYFATMEMKPIKGETFTGKKINDVSYIMANEALIRTFNLEDSIGLKLGGTIGWIKNPTVIGVVKDFHFNSLKAEIEPLMFLYNHPLNNFYIHIRLAPGKIAEGLSKVRALFQAVNTNSPFEYSFLDEDVAKQYEAEERWSRIITLATGMAIFLSVLGLLALAMFAAEQRRKEIGIRKVLGASLHQLIKLLSKSYLLLIAIAFVIAVPVSYYLISNYWLNNFLYRIDIGLFIYALTLVVVFLIAIIVIGSQTLKAALQNPTDVLKES
jgi:putative ABC transport system permease protein